MLRNKLAIVLLSGFFLAIPQIQASAQGKLTRNLNRDLTFFLFGTAIRLSIPAFDWILAQLNVLNGDAIPIDPKEEVVAQVALNEFLTNYDAIQVDFDSTYEALQNLSWQSLVKIILDPEAEIDLSFVAELVLHREHIRPAFENNDVEVIIKIRDYFVQRALRLRMPKENLRKLLRKLFPPVKRRDSSEGIQGLIARIEAPKDRLKAFDRWRKDNQFQERLNTILSQFTYEGSVRQNVQQEIMVLQEKLEKAREEKNREDFIGFHVQIFELIVLFETLEAEEDPFKLEEEQSLSAGQLIQDAIDAKGSARFIESDAVLQALVMGFEADHDAIREAEADDKTTDKQHRLSKGGNNRFIRGNLILSTDRDFHAGGAYKLFVKKNSGWFYEDTVIPVEINGTWMLLLFDRKKTAPSAYWYLVDEAGTWWRLRKNDKEAVLEEIEYSNFALAQNAPKISLPKASVRKPFKDADE